jgi:hypothetical protein
MGMETKNLDGRKTEMKKKIMMAMAVMAVALAGVVWAGDAENPDKEPGKPPDKAKPDTSKQEKEAAAAAEAWLKLVDEGKYGESWDEAADLFKKAITKDSWEQQVKAAREPFGKLISRKILITNYTTELPGAPDGEYVVITIETSFEKKKNSVETVTPMMDPDGKWRVSGYYIK